MKANNHLGNIQKGASSFGEKLCMLLFTLSGSTSLIYEVIWERQFTTVLGASSYAVMIVLAVFMAGLGIGAWSFGHIADRLSKNKLVFFYVIVEFLIGLYALIFPFILNLGEKVFVQLFSEMEINQFQMNLIRFCVAFGILIIPTTLMGATLPILTRYITHENSTISLTISRLYGLNTLGAFLGVVLSGYFLIPSFGLRFTTVIAACINFLISAIFFLFHFVRGKFLLKNSLIMINSKPHRILSKKDTQEITSSFQLVLIIAFALSGFAAMLYEVAWTRTLTMILGTTTFSFTTMLALFLLGLALGSLLFSVFSNVMKLKSLYTIIQFVTSLLVVITIPIFDKIPFMYLSLHEAMGGGWFNTQILRFCLAGIVMLPPTIAMGLAYPTLNGMIAANIDTLGQKVGTIYAINTLGSVLGAICAGLILIPLLGLKYTLLLGASLHLLSGLITSEISKFSDFYSRRMIYFLIAMTALIGVSFGGSWSPKILSSGVYVYANQYLDMKKRVKNTLGLKQTSFLESWKIWEMAMNQYELLYYDHGTASTVAVMERSDGVRFLTIDGKTDASTGKLHDMKTQIMLGQLPLLFHNSPQEVFVVGFGSGVTAGSILTHPVKKVECAELSAEVIRASSYFTDVNGSPLEDKRIMVRQRDARNVLQTSPQLYDIIVSQPSNPWISGQSSLFSKEWYELVARRLRTDGILAQWLPAYHMSKYDLRIIIKTMHTVFPFITMWTSGSTGELILIAQTSQQLKLNHNRIRSLLKNELIAGQILQAGIDPNKLIEETFLMNSQETTQFLSKKGSNYVSLPQNSDDNLITEFSGPKHMANGDKVGQFAHEDSLKSLKSSLHSILNDDSSEYSDDMKGI